jgi:predicted 2-oxoglutarate/Fe(II)-dependent dioxygenase YbiX
LLSGQQAPNSDDRRGTLVAFLSYVPHRVMPVTSEIRKSLLIWVGGSVFR